MLKPRWAGTVQDRRHGPLPHGAEVAFACSLGHACQVQVVVHAFFNWTGEAS